MDPVHDRGSMDLVHESGPWTRSKVGVHGPLVHVLSPPLHYKLLGNFLATSRISSNFLHSEQFLQLSSYSEMLEQLLVLKLAFLPYFTMFPVEKKPNPPPGADLACKIKVAGLGQRFLEKIQNGGRRFTLD